MSSGEFNVGTAVPSKPSSRVLKPPGGGCSSIFTGPEIKEQRPRNVKNQQNSTSMNEVMGTVDPNVILASQKTVNQNQSGDSVNQGGEMVDQGGDTTLNSHHQGGDQGGEVVNHGGVKNQSQQNGNVGTRGKVPPGGFSAGFW